MKFAEEEFSISCAYHGDANTVMSLTTSKIYNETVMKEDCINHLSIRPINCNEKLKKGTRETKHP